MLEREYEVFEENRDRFVKNHYGEFVVIQGDNVVGFYESENSAFEAMKGQELGSFMVKKCVTQEEEIQKFYSRVIFS